MSASIETTAINNRTMLLPYQISNAESKGLEELHSFYYPRGPIKKVSCYLRTAGALPQYAGHCDYYDFDSIARNVVGFPSFESSMRSTVFGGGKGFDLPKMMASSLGEIVERAFGANAVFDHDNRIIYATYNEMVKQGYNCIDPARIKLFADEQYAKPDFQYHTFDEDTFLGWIEGRRLLANNEQIWVPAQLMLPFYLSHPRERLIGYGTSGGLAAHISIENAVCHAISEVIERDAVNLHWNCGQAPKIIDIDCEPKDVRLKKLIAEARTLCTDFRLYLHPTDIDFHVVTAAGFIKGFNRYSYISGGGGGLTIEEAMLSALGEFTQAESSYRIALYCPEWRFANTLTEVFGVDEDTPVEKFDIFFKVLAHYGYESHAKKLKWYLDGSGYMKLSEIRENEGKLGKSSIDNILTLAKDNDLDPIIFDFTPVGLKSVKLVKVFCSKLTPPYLHSIPFFGLERYYTLPKQLGWRDRELMFDDFTKTPSPYP